eukprot:s3103_g2.t1
MGSTIQDPDSSWRALWFLLAALGNFYAAATVRFNDSGFTSGLCLLLPPFFMFNQLLIYTLGYPTMVLAGVTCGRSLVLHFGWADPRCLSGLIAAVGIGWFFRDVCCWVPHLGHLGGAGSSEGLDASYQRAGRYPACFATAMVLAALTTAAFSCWVVHSYVIALTLAVVARRTASSSLAPRRADAQVRSDKSFLAARGGFCPCKVAFGGSVPHIGTKIRHTDGSLASTVQLTDHPRAERVSTEDGSAFCEKGVPIARGQGNGGETLNRLVSHGYLEKDATGQWLATTS